MVKHEIHVQGVDMVGKTQLAPVLLQMPDTSFPAHFLQDLGHPSQPPVSATKTVVTSETSPGTLFQPVQRIVHLAMVQLNCDTLGFPPVAPTRVVSAGLVIRRVYRRPGVDGHKAVDEIKAPPFGWMRCPKGKFEWSRLDSDHVKLDPDPSKRQQLKSGWADLDQRLAAMNLSEAKTEVFTPAFVAPPEVCAAFGQTIVYALVPTASSEVSDTPPSPPSYDDNELSDSLPSLLKSGSPTTILLGQPVDARWMSDDFLWARFPPPDSTKPDQPDGKVTQFHTFSTTLRMLQGVFGAFDGSGNGTAILKVLDRHTVTQDGKSVAMGKFYANAASKLLNTEPAASSGFDMPTHWDSLNDQDESDLLKCIKIKLKDDFPNSSVPAPQGRFQDSTRLYTVRIFLRVKPENPECPMQLIWSHPSKPFRIAAWYESGGRPHPPIALPDPKDLKNLAQPNASFHVPAGLMGALQGSSLSSMMKGGKGGGGIKIDWICGFSIPLITICAFFVLNIFFSLLAIIFFWLPFFKICIPIPVPKPSDGGN